MLGTEKLGKWTTLRIKKEVIRLLLAKGVRYEQYLMELLNDNIIEIDEWIELEYESIQAKKKARPKSGKFVEVEGQKLRMYSGYDAKRNQEWRDVWKSRRLAKQAWARFVSDEIPKHWLVDLSKVGPDQERLLDFLRKHDFAGVEDLEAQFSIVEQEQENKKEEESERLIASSALDAEIPSEWTDGLGFDLFGYQKAGIKYAYDLDRVFIADEMGLGKTAQGIATVYARKAYPSLIICPSSLKRNWARELALWLPDTYSVTVIGNDVPKSFEVRTGEDSYVTIRGNNWNADCVVVGNSSAAISGIASQAAKKGFRSLIVDESHEFKNRDAKRTKALMEVSQKIPIRILLTGTAIVNSPCELASQLQVLGRMDSVFGGFWRFAKRYCDAQEGYRGWDFSGATNTKELNRVLRENLYVRRNKAEALAGLLPPKVINTVPLPLSNRDVYDRVAYVLNLWTNNQISKAEAFRQIAAITGQDKWIARAGLFSQTHEITTEDGITHKVMLVDSEGYTKKNWRTGEEPLFQFIGGRWLYDGERQSERQGFRVVQLGMHQGDFDQASEAPGIERIGILKQLAAEGKKQAVNAWIDQFLASTNKKLIVFGVFRETVERLARRYNAPFIHGGVSSANRQKAVDDFQYDPSVRVIVLNLKAGGVGLTLTAASDVAFVELGWTPGEHQQAEDRAHRLGQKEEVSVWYLLGEDSIELEIARLIEKKRVVVDAVNAGRDVPPEAQIAIRELERSMFGDDAREINPSDDYGIARREHLANAVAEYIERWEKCKGFEVI